MRKSSMFYGAIALSVSIGLLVLWMTRKPDPLERALELAGSNRTELEKVLEHYSKTEADSLKLKAAEFLIANMPGHFSYDTTMLSIYRPALVTYDSLIRYRKKHPELNLINRMDTVWRNILQTHNIYEDIYNQPVWEDTKYITSEFLIQDINKAFDDLEKSPYSDSIPIADFLEYVLPYRKQQGLCLENWRSYFCNDKLYDESYKHPMPIQQLIDSISYRYSDFIHTYNIMPEYPYLKLTDFFISKRADCSTKCWFNAMLFASAGIPVAIDFVPAWGNRNDKHQWNALIYNGRSHPFESFLENNRWRYKKLYNNHSTDPQYGDFRLAKVYRYSYKNQYDGPVSDPNVAKSDIPHLFLNIKKTDVSSEYFETCDVVIDLVNNPTNIRYAYLCTFSRDELIPVQWGKIEGNKAIFKNMGKDVVYVVTYCQQGSLIPASQAFLLDYSGKKIYFSPTKDTVHLTLKRKYPVFPVKLGWSESLVNGKFQGANRVDFSDAVDLHTIEQNPDFIFQTVPIHINSTFRYVRFLFDKNKYGNLAEVKFYTLLKGKQTELYGKMIYSSELISDVVGKALDDDIETFVTPYMPGRYTTYQWWVGMDFGTEHKIVAVGFCPRTDKNNIFPSLNYDLLYWNNGWNSLGKQQAITNELIYNVPNNALLILRCLDEGKEERIFTHENGKQVWR